MNALSRIDAIDQLFPEMFRRFGSPTLIRGTPEVEIRLDVTEHDKEYEVRAEIPGVKKEDIRVNVDGNFVSIVAEVRKEKEEKSGGRVLMKETFVGSASRGFSLAHEVDANAVVAKLDNGVLKLTLPKRNSVSGRSIAVQ
jgi:HSP20 family protein